MQFLINRPQYVKIEEYNSQTKQIAVERHNGASFLQCSIPSILYTKDIQSPAIGTVPAIK